MKVYKPKEQSLIFKALGLRGQHYLALGSLVYFDLTAPDDPLKEQDLWQDIPPLLGPQEALDQGYPKPRGEYLVTGKCFAPRGQSKPAAQVSVRVGEKQKVLNVLGNRQWKGLGGTMRGISAPLPFQEMPLTWKHAFGGDGFDDNPDGKGVAPLMDALGRSFHPLPNIEYPDRMIGSPDDRPAPACFSPLDVTRPVRQKKAGTYDEQWQQTRWPDFPDDINFEFFNVAPEDQFLPEYFSGQETIEISNMHPDYPVISSHLPPLRVRMFVTKKKDLKSQDPENIEFVELKNHIDTLWLFPEILRGVVMYRGSTPILDDEFADVVRIYVASENPAEPPKDMEYYYQQQLHVYDLSIPIDQGPMQKAQKKISTALKKIKALPKDIETAKKKAMGQAPRAPMPKPAQMAAKKDAMVADALALVGRLETMARKMHAEHGHRVKIDLKKFDEIRGKIQKASDKIDKSVAKLEESQKKLDAAKDGISESIKKNVSPENLAKTGVDPDNLSVIKPVNPWHDHGFPLVAQYRWDLDLDREAKKMLQDMGFHHRTVRRAWLGYNPEAAAQDWKAWGIKEEDIKPPAPDGIPRGLIMPRFAGPVLNRLLARPGDDWADPNQDFLAPGSDETPLYLPLEKGAPMVRVADELEAWFVEQEVGDAVNVITLKTPDDKPDDQAAEDLEAASVVLIVLPADTGNVNQAMPPWIQAFPKAQPLLLPKGKNVFEAHKAGIDIRDLVMEALPPDFAALHQIAPAIPEEGKPPAPGSPLAGLALPVFDIKALVEKLMGEIRASKMAQFEPLLKEAESLQAKSVEAIAKAGMDPKKILIEAADQPRKSFTEIGQQMAGHAASQRDKLKAMGQLTPEIEAKLKASEEQILKMGQEGDQKLKAGLAQIEEGKKKIAEAKAKAEAGEPPEAAKEKLKAAGLDPDKIRKRTREEVIDMHSRGQSLAWAILAGVDLSGLDLRGIDLNHSRLGKANLSGTNLEGANLEGAMAQESDFTGAVLKSANLETGLFQKAKFSKADLTEANLHKTILKKADLTGADLSNARLDWVILQKAIIKGAKLTGVRAEMGVFSDADATGTDFSGARFFKCLFKGTIVDQANFQQASFNSTMLQGIKGEKVTFAGANLDKARLAGDAVLAGADFRNTTMHEACFRESDLSGADFRGADLEGAMFEKCNLTKANFNRVSARHSRFNKSNLEGADMRAVNLFLGSLRKARLVNTDLRASNLYGVDFLKAVVGNTQFDMANLKMTQLLNKTDLLS